LHSTRSDVLVIGYGSLMSGLGLQVLGQLHVRGVSRVALRNARRGFGKFSQHGDRFAMVLEPLAPEQPFQARLLAPDAPPEEGPEGLALLLSPNDVARVAEREGYSSGAFRRLREEAAGARLEIAAFLDQLHEACGFDASVYRQQLFRLVGYTSPHYIPHPIRVDGQQAGLTFLAPGAEGSGSSRVVPVRVRTGSTTLMTLAEAWQRKPNRTQLTYFAACLLGGVHGVLVEDILATLDAAPGLCERLRSVLAAEQPQELARFLRATNLGQQAYWEALGPTTHSLRRSGLERRLRG
jgi:hypothetical protein